MTLKLTGEKAIRYVEELGGSHPGLRKYADPTDGDRDGLELEEAREISKADPSLIYFLADTSHPDHAAILERIA